MDEQSLHNNKDSIKMDRRGRDTTLQKRKTPPQAQRLTIRKDLKSMEFYTKEWGVCAPPQAPHP